MQTVRLIQSGEPVTPEVANRPIQDLMQHLSLLTNKVEAITDTANNTLYDCPLDEDVCVGAPVYLNTAKGTFSRARVSTSVEANRIVPDDCCYVLGIVAKKTSKLVGNICLNGVVDIDFGEGGNQDAYEDYTTLGIRYLSTLAGRASSRAPAIAVPIAFVLATNNSEYKATVLVSVNLDRVLQGHSHYRFLMKARPSGNNVQGSKAITEINANMEGWLPVVFPNSNAPANAKYYYNHKFSEINAHIPILTPSAFKLYWSQFSNAYDPLPVIGEVPKELYEVTADGIWWLSDEYLPWYMRCAWHKVVNTTTGQEESVPNSPASPVPMSMLASYTEISYGTDEAVVTSLQTPAGSGLSIVNPRTGELAIRGDLLIDLDLNQNRASENFIGSRTLKYIGEGYRNSADTDDVTGDGIVKNGWFFGPVVESFEVDSVFDTVESLNCTYTADNRPSGNILLRTGNSWGKLPLPVQSVHLDQMRDQFLGGMIAIAFMNNQRSGFSGNVYIPKFNRLHENIRLRFTLVGGAVGTVNDEDFSGKYVVIDDAVCNAELATSLGIKIPSLCDPAGDDGCILNFDFETAIPEPYSYFTICSEPILVTSGSMVWFSLHKEEGGYEGPLSVIKMEAYIMDDQYLDGPYCDPNNLSYGSSSSYNPGNTYNPGGNGNGGDNEPVTQLVYKCTNTIITLNKVNNYKATYEVASNSPGIINAANGYQISVDPIAGSGNRRFIVEKVPSLTLEGSYYSAFLVKDGNGEVIDTAEVIVEVPAGLADPGTTPITAEVTPLTSITSTTAENNDYEQTFNVTSVNPTYNEADAYEQTFEVTSTNELVTPPTTSTTPNTSTTSTTPDNQHEPPFIFTPKAIHDIYHTSGLDLRATFELEKLADVNTVRIRRDNVELAVKYSYEWETLSGTYLSISAYDIIVTQNYQSPIAYYAEIEQKDRTRIILDSIHHFVHPIYLDFGNYALPQPGVMDWQRNVEAAMRGFLMKWSNSPNKILTIDSQVIVSNIWGNDGRFLVAVPGTYTSPILTDANQVEMPLRSYGGTVVQKDESFIRNMFYNLYVTADKIDENVPGPFTFSCTRAY
jgi:hypothetical protein